MASKINIELYLTGLLQVVLVCLNTYQIALFAKSQSLSLIFGIAVVGFLISLIWSYNVKKVAFGSLSNRIWYALGASTGSVGGVILGNLIY